jgi:class 3 adenylate cyclase
VRTPVIRWWLWVEPQSWTGFCQSAIIRQAMWSAAMDVAGWLRDLGLGQYEANFRDNKIDADVLPHLTADDLKDIGVSAVGDRRKLIAAIAALADATPPAAVPAALRQSEPPNRARGAAERRPITVLFCDLVGSTSLAAKLDAEDWRNLLNVYLDEASKAAAGLGGHVLKRLGDGLMALFGYPQAQENDAERAVKAALAIQRAIAEINARNTQFGVPELVARIGIESGPVIVDSAAEVFGEAPNVAARVQATAEPGTVLVTSTVQRDVSGLFIVEDKGAHELKGVSAPMTHYRILRVSGGRRRKGPRVLTPFVGREEDLKVLARRWGRVRAGEGQFVLIVGEPGIGKSRLVEEFRARVGAIPHSWIEWTSSQLLQNTPLHPITDWGRVRFGGAEVPAERRFAELETVLAEIKLDPAEYAPLVAPLSTFRFHPIGCWTFHPMRFIAGSALRWLIGRSPERTCSRSFLSLRICNGSTPARSISYTRLATAARTPRCSFWLRRGRNFGCPGACAPTTASFR